MSIEGLEEKVIKWANARQLYQKSTDYTRFDKMAEEFEELTDELIPPDGSPPDIEKVKMEAGDVLVTIINILHPLGLDLETCLKAAFEKISKRKGKMIDGYEFEVEGTDDQANHPAHYTRSPVETIDIIKDVLTRAYGVDGYRRFDQIQKDGGRVCGF